MSTIWTYGRRPSSILRYRHGGYNAIYPLAQGETFHAVAETIRQERVAAESAGDGAVLETVRQPVPSENNILKFPSGASRRKQRDLKGRGTARSSVPPKSRD